MFFVSLAIAAFAASDTVAGDVVLPTARQLAWADCEIGVIIHQDLQTYRPFDWRKDPLPGPDTFAPTALDTDQWIRTAKAAGAKYAVLVAKHGTGFSLWPTKAHGYSVAHSPWKGGKGDVVADFIASCRKYGVKPGIYASTGCNGYLGVDDNTIRDAKRWAEYLKVVRTQLTELWTNYGELFEIWFDGGNLPADKGGREIEDLLVKLQPNAIVFQGNPARMDCVRWIGNERARAPETCWNRTQAGTSSDGMAETTGTLYAGSFDGRYWCPGEADVANRDQCSAYLGGWIWHADEDATLYPPEELLERYFTSVGRGCNMLIGMAIDNRGLVPEADVRQFTRFGELVRGLYTNKVVSVSGKGKVFEFAVPKGARPNLLSVQEDLTRGELLRSFALHGFDGKAWHTLVHETNMGHRRLVRFRPGAYEKYRLLCWDTRDEVEPTIRDCSLYVTDRDPASARPLVVGISDSCAYDQGPDVRYYVDAVERAGHIPVIIGMTLDTNRLASVVARLDTLLMTGGADVEPARYGAVRLPKCGGTDPKRDAYEFALVAAARARRLPVAGICRGVQLLNVAFGGTLYQDLPSEFKVADGRVACSHSVGRWDHDHTNPPAHTVSFTAGSRWSRAIGAAPLAVNSHHHQAVLRLAPGFRIAAQAPDGVIEAIEGDDYPVVGVQFHPESLISTGATKGFDRVRLLQVVAFLCEHGQR